MVMELLTLKSMLLLFGVGETCINKMKWRRRWYFIKPWKKFFSNLFSTWEKRVSLNCDNFCRTTHLERIFNSRRSNTGKVGQKYYVAYSLLKIWNHSTSFYNFKFISSILQIKIVEDKVEIKLGTTRVSSGHQVGKFQHK